MAGSPKKRARRAGLHIGEDLFTRSAQARRDAEAAAAREITAWWQAERRLIEADDSLAEIERERAVRALLMELGRRSKRAIAKAKRDSSPAKLLESEAWAAIEGRGNS